MAAALQLQNRKIASLKDTAEISELDEEGCKSLQRLNLSHNALEKLDGLEVLLKFDCSQLAEINLSGNQLSLCDAVLRFHGLVHLDLSDNNILNVPDMSAMQRLEKVSLANNALTEMKFLRCTNVVDVDLSYNKIEEISDISELKMLKTLLLDGNLIESSKSWAVSLPRSLTLLSLRRNNIKSIMAIAELQSLLSLRTLNVEENPFVTSSVKMHFNYKPFVLFIVPTVSVLNANPADLSDMSASRNLFRDDKGEVVKSVINKLKRQAWLDETSSAEHDSSSSHSLSWLFLYLRRCCPLKGGPADNSAFQITADDLAEMKTRSELQRSTSNDSITTIRLPVDRQLTTFGHSSAMESEAVAVRSLSATVDQIKLYLRTAAEESKERDDQTDERVFKVEQRQESDAKSTVEWRTAREKHIEKLEAQNRQSQSRIDALETKAVTLERMLVQAVAATEELKSQLLKERDLRLAQDDALRLLWQTWKTFLVSPRNYAQ